MKAFLSNKEIEMLLSPLIEQTLHIDKHLKYKVEFSSMIRILTDSKPTGTISDIIEPCNLPPCGTYCM